MRPPTVWSSRRPDGGNWSSHIGTGPAGVTGLTGPTVAGAIEKGMAECRAGSCPLWSSSARSARRTWTAGKLGAGHTSL